MHSLEELKIMSHILENLLERELHLTTKFWRGEQIKNCFEPDFFYYIILLTFHVYESKLYLYFTS
jgi:hypothetical protein